MKIVISSGHGKHVRGAAGPEPWGLDEVDEARRVVTDVAEWLKLNGQDVVVFHDDTSTTQDQNLKTIVNFHNAQGPHDLDVSVHFNAYTTTDGGRGTECLYVTQIELATSVAAAIAAESGLINRGPKKRSDLYFLNKTNEPSILIEVCFVDAKTDVEIYDEYFSEICEAIACAIAPSDEAQRPDKTILRARGKVSWFGGPDDEGVSPDEGLAFIYDVDDKPHLFLDQQPSGTTGLARRLDPDKRYVAMRWDYDQFPKDRLAGDEVALVRASDGKQFTAHPADWGPHSDTARVADISPRLMADLGIETDDEVEIIYPYHAPHKK